MKVILLKDVAKVGKKFDVKDVSDGYALNFLIPQGKAKTATTEGLAKVEALKSQAEADRKVQEDLLAKNLHEIDGKSIEIKEKANASGHLFGSLHKERIAELLSESIHSSIEPSFIALEKPIKETGEHEIEVVAAGKKATV
ncbi:MAG TPA: 50S ribosomal protein L9, partial [Candidatus Paceibacterota bacterium]|nr:50S ribosomal protein L9 [Candidatus Paceibacterota bacterium]